MKFPVLYLITLSLWCDCSESNVITVASLYSQLLRSDYSRSYATFSVFTASRKRLHWVIANVLYIHSFSEMITVSHMLLSLNSHLLRR